MAGLTSEEIRFALWFLLAGVIIGFAVSSVWEWLYYRGKRWGLDGTDPFEVDGGHTATPGARLETKKPAVQRGGLPAAPAAPSAAAEGVPPKAASSDTASDEQFRSPARAAAERPISAVRPARPTDESTAGRSRGLPDDLTRITGISPLLQQRLYQAHVFTWHQVATSDVEVLAQITGAGDEVFVGQWPAQARALAAHHNRTNASYSGPIPEDLTQIQGLSRVHANGLNQVGIVTFGQLAMASGTELAALFEEQDGENPPDYEAWLRTAAFLARRNGSAGAQPATIDGEAHAVAAESDAAAAAAEASARAAEEF